MAMDSILSHFGALDDLIQVIYQGVERFVILSAVAEFSWTIYVGLKGPEGRWWRGSWSAGEITEFIVRSPVYFRCLIDPLRCWRSFHAGFKVKPQNSGKVRAQPIRGVCAW